jgi:hypothetical protein
LFWTRKTHNQTIQGELSIEKSSEERQKYTAIEEEPIWKKRIYARKPAKTLEQR